MHFIIFIITTIIQLFSTILLLRVWINLVKLNLYNQFFEIIFRTTKKIIDPIYKSIANICNFNVTIILFTYILTLINILCIILLTNSLTLINTKLFIISFIQLLTYIGKLIFWLILIRLIFNWISNKENQIYYILLQLTEPLIQKIRKTIPTFLGLDLSYIIIILILIVLKQIRFNILLFIEPNTTQLLASIGYLI